MEAINMRNVVVMGIGLHKYGRHPDKSFEQLTYPAVNDALIDSGIPFKEEQYNLARQSRNEIEKSNKRRRLRNIY